MDPILVEAVFGVMGEKATTLDNGENSKEPIPEEPEIKWPVTIDQLSLLQIKDPFL